MSDVPCGRIYRSLHGSPMLAGVPAHVCLLLLATASLGGFGAMMIVSTFAGILAVALVGVVWAALAFTFTKDRVAAPLFLLKLRYRFPPVIASFSRGSSRVVLEEGGE